MRYLKSTAMSALGTEIKSGQRIWCGGLYDRGFSLAE
jgi:hypothetical protein